MKEHQDQIHQALKTSDTSVVKVPMDLPRHDHHPKVEYRIDKLKRKGRFPAITCKDESEGVCTVHQGRRCKRERRLTDRALR